MSPKKLTLVLAAGLLIVAIGGSLFGVWHYRHFTLMTVDIPPQTSPRATPSPMDLADYYGYIKQASLTCRDLESPAAANVALNSALPHHVPLTRIVKRGQKLDSKGQRVGRRIITWSCCGVEGQSVAHIYWTDGSKFCDIIAASVAQALYFERSHNL